MIPGLVAGISIKGKTVWTQAFGRTDIENDVKIRTDSVWRMASISKALTSALMAKLIEKGLIDLKKSIKRLLETTLILLINISKYKKNTNYDIIFMKCDSFNV
jgi:CubicO group peptidase (beta-lactamase class C family)